MKPRTRAELITAGIYLIAIPFAVVFASLFLFGVVDLTNSPTLPDWLLWLTHTLPALVCGFLLFVAVREATQANVENASLARWLFRAAPLWLAAAVISAQGAWLLFGQGETGLNGLIVIPALALLGSLAGESVAHQWLARGRPGGLLLRRSFLTGGILLGALVLAGLVLRSPAGELEAARKKCRDQYARSATAEDSAFTGEWMPTVARHVGTRSCADLLAAERAHGATPAPK